MAPNAELHTPAANATKTWSDGRRSTVRPAKNATAVPITIATTAVATVRCAIGDSVAHTAEGRRATQVMSTKAAVTATEAAATVSHAPTGRVFVELVMPPMLP